MNLRKAPHHEPVSPQGPRTPRCRIIFILCFIGANLLSVFAAEDAAVQVERNVAAAMRDGVVLRADVFRPDRGGPYPVLVMRTPYGKQGKKFDPYVKAGYIVVCQDARGRYESEGKWESLYRFDTHDAADGFDTVEWAAKLPGANGKVGTFGSSYNAFLQWRLAPLRPPSLVAMAASSIPPRMAQLEGPGTLRPGRRLSWFYGGMTPDLRARSGAPGPKTKPEAAKLWKGGEEKRLLNFLPWLDLPDSVFEDEAQAMKDWLRHPHLDPCNLLAGCPDVAVPNLDIVGWFDHCNDSIELDQALMQRGRTEAARQTRLIIGPWSHSGRGKRKQGDVDFGPSAAFDLIQTEIAWFDHWLKGKAGAAKEAPVKIFVMGANQWRDENEWPPRRAQPRTFFLASAGHANTPAGDGSLVDRPPAAATDSYRYDPRDPVPTLWTPAMFTVPADQRPLAQRQDILVYQSAPLAAALEVTGYPEVVLHASSSAADTDFFARLIDVAPDGVARDVAMGMVRARFREGLDRPKLLEPGQVTEFKIRLRPTANEFQAGHRIRLDITSSDFPNYDRNHNTAADQNADAQLEVAEQTVHHGGASASRLILPVIARTKRPGNAGSTPAAPEVAVPPPLTAERFAAIAQRLEKSAPLRPSTPAVAAWTRSARMITWAGSNAGNFRDIDTPEEASRRAAEIKALGFNTVLVSGRHFRQCFRDEPTMRQIVRGLRLAVGACHAEGLRVIDHHDLTVWWSEAYPTVLAHPDWVQVDVRHGTPLRWFCPNNDEFVADMIAYLLRLQRETGVDGFMSDEIGFRPESCGCRHCRAGFERDTGYRLPEDAGSATLDNADDPLWRLWLRWRSISLNRFQHKLLAALNPANPDLLWLGYSTTSTSPGLADSGTDMFSRSRMVNFPGVEGTNITFPASAYWYVDLRDRLAIAREHGRFGWSQFPTTSGAELQFAAFLSAVTGHGAWTSSGARDDTAAIFNWEHWERLTHPRAVTADVAVVFSISTRDGAQSAAALHEEEFLGWGQSLLRLGIQYDVLIDQAMTAEDLRRFRIVIVPGASSLPPAASKALSDFSRAGGALLVTGQVGARDQHGFELKSDPLREALGLIATEPLAAPTPRKGRSIAEPPQVMHATEQGRRDLRLEETAITMMHCQAYRSRYAAGGIAQPLMQFADDEPALIEAAHGGGRLLHFSFLPARVTFEPKLSLGTKVTRRGNPVVDRLLASVLRRAAGDGPLAGVGSAGVTASIFGEENRRVVHLLNTSGVQLPADGVVLGKKAGLPNYPALPAMEIFVRCPPPKSATLFNPDAREPQALTMTYKKGLLKIAVPAESFRRYAAVEVVTE